MNTTPGQWQLTPIDWVEEEREVPGLVRCPTCHGHKFVRIENGSRHPPPPINQRRASRYRNAAHRDASKANKPYGNCPTCGKQKGGWGMIPQGKIKGMVRAKVMVGYPKFPPGTRFDSRFAGGLHCNLCNKLVMKSGRVPVHATGVDGVTHGMFVGEDCAQKVPRRETQARERLDHGIWKRARIAVGWGSSQREAPMATPRDIDDVQGLSADARRLFDWMTAAFTGNVNEALADAKKTGASISKWTHEQLREAHTELKKRGVLSPDAPNLKPQRKGAQRSHATMKRPALSQERSRDACPAQERDPAVRREALRPPRHGLDGLAPDGQGLDAQPLARRRHRRHALLASGAGRCRTCRGAQHHEASPRDEEIPRPDQP